MYVIGVWQHILDLWCVCVHCIGLRTTECISWLTEVTKIIIMHNGNLKLMMIHVHDEITRDFMPICRVQSKTP